MNMKFLRELTNLKFNYEVGKKTWFGTGGISSAFILINNESTLKILMKIIPKNFPLLILGAGSNILIRDGGFKGLTVKLGNDFKQIYFQKKEMTLIVGSGVKDSEISKFCHKNSFSGFEFLKGIPGTIGGNIFMNAGCYGSVISDLLLSCRILTRNAEIKELNRNEIKFGYRHSSIDKDAIILSAKFIAKKGTKKNIAKKLKKISNERINAQPVASRTGGSTFKNPPNESAWKLIDKINYRGRRLGGAIVSKHHTNFMINENLASSLDIELLGEEIKEKVKKKFKINLDWEIKRVGEFKKI